DGLDAHVQAIGVPAKRGKRWRIDERLPDLFGRVSRVSSGSTFQPASSGSDRGAAGNSGAVLLGTGRGRVNDRGGGDIRQFLARQPAGTVAARRFRSERGRSGTRPPVPAAIDR